VGGVSGIAEERAGRKKREGVTFSHVNQAANDISTCHFNVPILVQLNGCLNYLKLHKQYAFCPKLCPAFCHAKCHKKG
jgi:hypothetical protein